MLVSNFELRKNQLDFSSSGQGRFEGTELVVNGIQLVNAIELLDFTDGMVQLLVCEACGVKGCEPGAWAAVRRVCDMVVLVPAIDAMREGGWESNEYSPPRYIMKHGPVVFDLVTYQALRNEGGRFPDPDRIEKLSSTDALAVLQLTAPGRVLGPLGMPVNLNAENIVAVTEGDLENEIYEFRKLIDRVQSDRSIRIAEVPSKVTEFHLDIPGFGAWRPFGYDTEGNAVLNLNSAVSSL